MQPRLKQKSKVLEVKTYFYLFLNVLKFLKTIAKRFHLHVTTA